MKKAMMIGLGVVALAAGGVGTAALTNNASPGLQSAAPIRLQSARFAVENMTCATCPITVRRAMMGVEGVKEVAVDYQAKTATARFDPTLTSIGAIAAASTNAGYPAKLMKESS